MDYNSNPGGTRFEKTSSAFYTIPLGIGERCTEPLDAVLDMKARLCGVVDWLFSNPDYDSKPRVIPKEKYPVLVDVTF